MNGAFEVINVGEEIDKKTVGSENGEGMSE